MNDDYQLVMSPLCRSITENGHTVSIEIYRGTDTNWTLEAVDAAGNSTVWEDPFATDQAALDEALRTIREEGIESLVGPPVQSTATGLPGPISPLDKPAEIVYK